MDQGEDHPTAAAFPVFFSGCNVRHSPFACHRCVTGVSNAIGTCCGFFGRRVAIPLFPLFLLPSPFLLPAIHSPLYPWGEGGTKKYPSMSNRSEKGRPPPSLGLSSAVPAPVGGAACWMDESMRPPPAAPQTPVWWHKLSCTFRSIEEKPFLLKWNTVCGFKPLSDHPVGGTFWQMPSQATNEQQWRRRRGREEGGGGGRKKKVEERGNQGGKMGRKEGVICVRTTTTTRGGRVARTKCCGGKKGRNQREEEEEKGNRGGPKGGPRRFF